MNISSPDQVWRWVSQRSYGIYLMIAIAGAAYLLRSLPILQLFSPLIIAIILGMIFRNTIGMPANCQSGVTFVMKRILRFAIVLLGLQLSIAQVLALGIKGIGLIILTLFITFGFTYWLGRLLGVSRSLTYLIASGTSVAIVTIFGTLSMFLYPLLPNLLSLTPETFGIWCGASIHEVAQVLAASYQVSPISGELASITKLSRVLCLAPVTLMITYIYSKRKQDHGDRPAAAISIPWFIFYFMLLIALNSLNIFPSEFKSAIEQVNKFLLTISMAAMGMETKIMHLMQTGLKPLYLGAFSWLFISILSFGLIKAFY